MSRVPIGAELARYQMPAAPTTARITARMRSFLCMSARAFRGRERGECIGDVVERDRAGDLSEGFLAQLHAHARRVAQAFAAAGAQARDQLADLARGIGAVAGEQQAPTAVDQLEVELAAFA